MKKLKPGTWLVSFDPGLCSICEICVRRCPSAALEIRREGALEQIWFLQERCDGCKGEPVCGGVCPEKAVTVKRARAARRAPALVKLISGEMSRCRECGALFAPQRKLEALLDKGKISARDFQGLCPPCRRNRLLDACISAAGG